MVTAARLPQTRTSEIQGDIAPRVTRILRSLGENPERPGLLDTPARVERSLRELTHGYHQDLDEVVNGALFPTEYQDVVLVRDIDVYSMCEHHLLPFFGKAHVAYLPEGQVIGLSKVPRIVEMYSRRLQLQENLSQQIAAALEQVLSPRGVAVALECEHLCMTMRGVQKPGSTTVTRTLTGAFRHDEQARAELISLSGGSGSSRLWG